MDKLVVLSDFQKYPYHKTIYSHLASLSCFQNYQISLIDISSSNQPHLLFNALKELNPQVVITLDLAGFSFRTILGGNALNILHSKNLNLIWGHKEEYKNLLSERLSLSMLFFDCSDTPCDISKLYSYVDYYNSLGTVLTNELTASDTEHNKEILEQIATCFLEEIGN